MPDTFNPEVQPSPGTGFQPKISLYKAEFGDGYTQAVPMGLNHIRQVLSLKWEGLTQEQALAINNFFISQGGYKTFLYQPVGYLTPMKWTCSEWSMSASAPWTITAKLEESFHIVYIPPPATALAAGTVTVIGSAEGRAAVRGQSSGQVPVSGVASGAVSTNFVTAMQNLLSGTPGWVIDPADTTTVFTDAAGTTPVTTPGVSVIGRINSKFGTGSYNWTQSAGPGQPIWMGGSKRFDPALNQILINASFTGMQGVNGITFTSRFRVDDLSINRCIISIGTSSATAIRFRLQTAVGGALSVSMRRLAADVGQTFTTAGGLITTGVSYTAQVTINYLTGAVEIFLNGVSVLTGTYTAVDGVNGLENTTAARSRIGVNNSNTLNDYYDGDLGCMAMVLSVLNSSDLAICRGFVERNPL